MRLDHTYKIGEHYRHHVHGLGEYCRTCKLLTTSDNQRGVIHLSFNDKIRPVSGDMLRRV